jgi:uncharacterized damage-inducible protein DinB
LRSGKNADVNRDLCFTWRSIDVETAYLANHIKRTATGPMWHGPALDQLLDGVTAAEAAAHPIPGAHSIWELVLHAAAWAEIARARLRGERIGDPPPDEDWPPVTTTDDAAWAAAAQRLHDAHRALARDVRHLEDATLHEKIPGLEYSRSNLLRGVVEHSTYHGGQIALLKRALR